METPLPPWVREAAKLPVAFAQVREDPRLDRWVVEQVGPGARVILVASGGCTAAALAVSGMVGRLHLVDPNPAQVALARLKLRLLQTAEPRSRFALLGHAPLPPLERAARLATELAALDLAPDVLGPRDLVADWGPDHAGRYERVFAQLRDALQPVANELADVLESHAPAEQATRVEPDTALGRALDYALDDVMALPHLVALFGEGATRNRVEPFARHFARRTRHVLATLPAADNPFLWQMYRGRYPEGAVADWLTAHAPQCMPEVTWSTTVMTTALRDMPGAFDFVHLSNILDWLSPEEAAVTLELAAGALRPGGWVLIRQLNSSLVIPALGPAFAWHGDQARALHARDRSFFYRNLHLGRKR